MDKKFSELFSAFDYIDEIIYICDMDSYDLVYCNKRTKEVLLADYEEDQPGSKCYRCLQGLEQPCVFCNNDTLKKTKRCIWSRQHPQSGRHYLIHDSVLTIDGHDYRMELAVDATHMEEAEAHTRAMLEMETHLTDCVRSLVRSGNFANSVSAVLQTVLNFYGGERAYLFEYDWENQVANNTYEICTPGVHPEIDTLQDVPLEHLHVWTGIFRQHRTMVIEDIDALQHDASRSDEYETLSRQGIRGIIAVPIYSGEMLIGFIGVDNPKTNFVNSDFLVDLAYFIGAEIRKNQVVQRLKDLSYHDSLTGVYNRKGLEQIMENRSEDNLPIGFAMLDLDNFKLLNDSCGREVGDQVLKETANMLVSMSRKEDAVFRLEGDQFAILLNHCSAAAWKTLCSKIQWVHSVMAEKYPDHAITMSVGICFSEKDYSERVYQLAEEAMHETRRNGRAGCTMINESTGEKRCWNDDSLSSHSKNLLKYNSTGLFRIEYPLDGSAQPRMICSDIVREMFAFPADANPEQCFRLWRDGMEPSYEEALHEARVTLLSGVQAECTYEWRHPAYGLIHIRSTGVGGAENGVQTVYGFHHSLKDTQIVERTNESQLLLDAISSIYFGSYYINLENGTYFTVKNAPNERFLQVEENCAQDSLQNFVSVLVRTEERDKMMKFVNLETLPARIEHERHLDCEYVSTAEKSWCRASFIPVRRAKDGRLTHVMFVVSPLDVYAAREFDINIKNKKTIESLYNHVPGGLVMYEWANGELKTLQMSRYYYEQYGYSMLNQGGPDFKRVHPDDIEGYRTAVQKALTETHQIDYTYRVWNRNAGRYVWTKINAVSEVQSDGTSLVYAMYSDVTEQKETEMRLRKRQASLAAALSASNQLCYEYDPVTHVEECLTEDTVFHLPRLIQNYPESMIERDVVHPEDAQTFLSTVRMMERGAEKASCNIRLEKDGSYTWFSCSFRLFYDAEKEHNVVLLSVLDISEHMATVQNYQSRMQMLMNMTEDAMSFGSLNVTENTFSVVQVLDGMREITERVATLDDLFRSTAAYVVGHSQREQYRKLFSRANLLSMMERGQLHVHLDHLYQMSSTHIEWVRTCVDLLKNPSTGEVVGVCYAKSIQAERITNILLEKTLQRDYPLAAVVLTDSDEYYLFNPERAEYCVQRRHFWDSIPENLALVVDEKVSRMVQNEMSKEKVLAVLARKNEFIYAFDCRMNGKPCRLEVKFSKIDSNIEMLMATLRDITDTVIMARLRHDNERDHLTDLYNRRKTFAVCRRLLEDHPEDEFAMLHFDIRHFRLYNTFFGDAAGDRLLCDIADMFRKMSKDYDYWAYGRIESDVFCVFFPISQNKYQKHLQDLLNGLQGYRTDFLIEPVIGIYTVTDRSMSIESMFTRASIAAKTIKSGVTGSVVFYNEAMEQDMSDEQQIVNEMQTAIEQEQFQVYLQPKYSLQTGQPVGAEALVRWMHPQKGLVSPAKFIPVFESNGFIATLDRYMWEHVCRLLRKWKDAGLDPTPISVNVSRISMYSPATVRFLKDLVQKYGLEPRYLELELTESAYMDDPDEMKKQLKELQQFGFHILMDDFGSGYSSLNTLRELPVDVLKLDMKFLSESGADERGRLVLSSVVRMSRLLHLTIIAEGVETREQAEFLHGLGCEFAQGYLFAHPMPVSEYEALLEQTAVQGEAQVTAQLMEDGFPAPAVRMEIEDGRVSHRQFNALFASRFGMEKEKIPLAEMFRRHLTEEDWNGLMQAYAKCAATQKQTRFSIRWMANGEAHPYLGWAAYEGVSGRGARIVAAFLDAAEEA